MSCTCVIIAASARSSGVAAPTAGPTSAYFSHEVVEDDARLEEGGAVRQE